jgi:hypothetical protein
MLINKTVWIFHKVDDVANVERGFIHPQFIHRAMRRAGPRTACPNHGYQHFPNLY